MQSTLSRQDVKQAPSVVKSSKPNLMRHSKEPVEAVLMQSSLIAEIFVWGCSTMQTVAAVVVPSHKLVVQLGYDPSTFTESVSEADRQKGGHNCLYKLTRIWQRFMISDMNWGGLIDLLPIVSQLITRKVL